MALVGKQKELDADGSGNITGKDFALLRERNKKQEGGEMAMPPELATEAPMEDTPVDTYPNATPEELEAANQKPDAEMEDDYIEFVVSESLDE